MRRVVLAVVLLVVSVAAPARADMHCTITGTEDADVLTGTDAADVICGLGGDDVISGLGGDDTLLGGDGDDTLDGGDGNDALDGESGSLDVVTFAGATRGVRVDLLAGTASGAGSDTVAGVEKVIGSPFDDLIYGSDGDDRVDGARGNDVVFGRAGTDVLYGGIGQDYLDGTSGGDTLIGGSAPGPDMCRNGASIQRCSVATIGDRSRDTYGVLDIVRVETALATERPVWRFTTRNRWSTAYLDDRAWFFVDLDTRGGTAFDYFALIGGVDGRLQALLFRYGSSGDVFVRSLEAWRSNRYTVSVRVPLESVAVSSIRNHYRWATGTVELGPSCPSACLDAAPQAGAYTQALPRVRP